MDQEERELVEYFIEMTEKYFKKHNVDWTNPPLKITTWKHLLELDKQLEDIKIINEEHKILNGMIRKELQQKENIIKEVREWSKKLKYETLWQTTREELEEILDKENIC